MAKIKCLKVILFSDFLFKPLQQLFLSRQTFEERSQLSRDKPQQKRLSSFMIKIKVLNNNIEVSNRSFVRSKFWVISYSLFLIVFSGTSSAQMVHAFGLSSIIAITILCCSNVFTIASDKILSMSDVFFIVKQQHFNSKGVDDAILI